MKWKGTILGVIVLGFALACSTSRVAQDPSDRIRQLESKNISSYHDAIQLEVAWVPYTEHSLVQTKQNEWKVVKNPAIDTSSALPMILITYPGKPDTLWLDMNIDNETLGMLVKHSMMTQIPITRPFTEFIEIAKCQNCHPSNVMANLD